MTLGNNIKRRREELKLSQEYVAEQLGVSRQAVSKWETDQSEPTASNLIRLAEVFEMKLSELVEPDKCLNEQSGAEKNEKEKKPDLILRANLIRIAITAQVAFFVQLHLIYLPTTEYRLSEQDCLPRRTDFFAYTSCTQFDMDGNQPPL